LYQAKLPLLFSFLSFHGVAAMHTRLNKSTPVWKHSQACLFQVEVLGYYSVFL